ncbi:hypothetical protein [Candidatus Blastococcus massiliensis]|uniref:hypothetical protein n=1 Tax=Candidatus Blastococcus massiliensis TaxID=1470358 RepID=UPI0004B62DA0|nr:hypothetical protein [Candidatus Blastococcus massiliensis]
MTTTATAPSLLRLALRTDAVVSGLNGAAYLLLTGPLSDLLGLPSGHLRGLGIFLLVYAAGVWLVAERPLRPAVGAVIVGNLLWVAGSLVVVAADVGTPTTTGAVWVVLQAVVVAAFAVLQFAGLRRSPDLSDRWAPSGRA